MPVVTPKEKRAEVVQTPAGLRIAIPAPRPARVITLLFIALILWALGEIEIVRDLAEAGLERDDSQLAPALVVLGIAGWTASGIMLLFLVSWGLFGWERISLTASNFQLRREVFGLGWTRIYDLVSIRRLRVTPTVPDSWSAPQFPGFGSGPIAFDYGTSTIRFAKAIDDSEADRLVTIIKNHHYFPNSATGS